MGNPSFKISTKILYIASWLIYSINISVFFFLFSIITSQNYFNTEYVYAGIVGGFIMGSIMHVRIFKVVMWGGQMDVTSFLLALILVPLYPATFLLLKLYRHMTIDNKHKSNYD